MSLLTSPDEIITLVNHTSIYFQRFYYRQNVGHEQMWAIGWCGYWNNAKVIYCPAITHTLLIKYTLTHIHGRKQRRGGFIFGRLNRWMWKVTCLCEGTAAGDSLRLSLTWRGSAKRVAKSGDRPTFSMPRGVTQSPRCILASWVCACVCVWW